MLKSPQTREAASSLDGRTAFVRVDALRKFSEVVTRLGGDPLALLENMQISPPILASRHAVIPYRTLVQLLERASAKLGCPDFGMQLAAEQGGAKVLGPLEIVMSNSRNLREAFRYCESHVQAYSTGTQIHIEESRSQRAMFLRFEILLERLPYQRQAVEQALLLTQHNALGISGGRVSAREIWFTHEPLAAPATYRSYFGATVRFSQSMNGLLFAPGDLDTPIPNGDPQLYELATSFIELHYPYAEQVLSTRVRTIVERLLLEGNCTFRGVGSALGMHPRALQRGLHSEGKSFEGIKDGVRRDIALRYLRQSELSLTQVAEILGYAETSVLSRSCNRWFSTSPRQLRAAPHDLWDQ